jgi:signal transduction histidine kinase
MANEKKSPIDTFFNLGAKITKGDPVAKSKFDYQLYWVIFLTFIFVSFNYFRIFFITHAIGSLLWGIIILVFSWFNYWGLMAFRQTYENMKKFYANKQQTAVNNGKSKEDSFEKAFSN